MSEEFEHVICQGCGGVGDSYEVIEGDYPVNYQEWLWCKSCEIESFKDLPNETKSL